MALYRLSMTAGPSVTLNKWLVLKNSCHYDTIIVFDEA